MEQNTTVYADYYTTLFGIFDAFSGRFSDAEWGILPYEYPASASVLAYLNLYGLEKSYISLMAFLDFLARVESTRGTL